MFKRRRDSSYKKTNHPAKKSRTGSFADNLKQPGTMDPFTILIVGILSFFGWIMIYSGSFYLASQRKDTILYNNNPYHFFILQGAWILAGVITAVVVSRVNFRLYKAIVIPGIITIITLLIIVLILPGTINGAKLWIKIGPFSLQPSEFAKPVIIVYLAGLFARDWHKKGSHKSDLRMYIESRLLPFLIVSGTIAALVLLGRDLASAGVVGGIAILLYFMSDNSTIHNITSISLSILMGLMGVIFTLQEKYRMARLETYLSFLKTGEISNPTSTGYQLRQILIAVGSGGVFGYGFGQSKQKYLYLQETAFSDTIFAVIAEEFGLIGSLAVTVAFLILFLWWLKLAQKAPNKFASLIILGVTIWIFSQTVIHIGVNVGMLPLTGITLPFMSYGGSSYIACMIGVGMILNISREIKL